MTEKEAKAAASVVLVVAEAIRDLKRVPSGHLYAHLMGHLSLESYNQIIAILKKSGIVREENHELIYIAD